MAWIIYLFGVLDNLQYVLIPIFVLSAIVILICALYSTSSIPFELGLDESERKAISKTRSLFTKVLCAALLLAIFVPDSKTVAAMYLIPKISENKQLNQIPDKVLNILNKKLDDWVTELQTQEKK
ncbi:MAG: hypothetical protein KBD78_04070 [Oligoflexales bacterium]|nr:hypothetical protein [Oligoflexales bacterium]